MALVFGIMAAAVALVCLMVTLNILYGAYRDDLNNVHRVASQYEKQINPPPPSNCFGKCINFFRMAPGESTVLAAGISTRLLEGSTVEEAKHYHAIEFSPSTHP